MLMNRALTVSKVLLQCVLWFGSLISLIIMYLLRWLSSRHNQTLLRLLMWIVLEIASVPSVVKQGLACAFFILFLLYFG